MSHAVNVTPNAIKAPAAPMLAVGTRVTHPTLGGGVVLSNADTKGRANHCLVRSYRGNTRLEGPVASLTIDARRLSIVDGGRADETRIQAYLRASGTSE